MTPPDATPPAAPIETFEIERKYAVSDTAQLPGERALATAGLTVGATERRELEASYFDTPDGALGRARVAVRRRRGGPDAGWHLKERGDDGVRELQWPLSDEVPAGLVAEMQGRVGPAAEQLVMIARLSTVRLATLVRDAAGNAVIELVDDQVEAENLLTGRTQAWREWEAELVDGADAATLDALEPLLVAAGAERVRGTSKIQRVMGA